MPDLSKHSNIMAEVLYKNPNLYDQYKKLKTRNNIGLAKCIKTGIDNPGHPMIKTCGLVAGDEECYTLFKDLFDKVIDLRHHGYSSDAKHVTDLDFSKLSATKIDPTGKYVISSRIRTGRSIAGYRLPPSLGKDERRQVEATIVRALNGLTGELKGQYFSLTGSYSIDEEGGMSKEIENQLREDHFLFQEPDSPLLLSSGMAKNWPDARGIFHNDQKNFLVWVNEEDHMRLISMQMGDDIKEVFTRFCKAATCVEDVFKSEGKHFMHNDHLGYLLTCPSNAGTGLRASAMIRLPLLCERPDFKAFCQKMGIQARGGAGENSPVVDGIYDMSNSARLGKSEVELVNIMIEGCAKLVKMEQLLGDGEPATVEEMISSI